MYPDHNPADGCGKLSSACEQFFIEEGCFYECDHNLGKWRKHEDCDGGNNGWEIEGMPIKASYCDAWYEACKGPENKLCMGSNSTEGAPQYGYFAQPDCHTEQGTAGCKRIDEVYTSGFHMCETMWAGSFKYESDTSKDAYVMSFDEGITNPNNAMFLGKEYPPVCEGDLGFVNITQAEIEGCTEEAVSSTHSYLGTADQAVVAAETAVTEAEDALAEAKEELADATTTEETAAAQAKVDAAEIVLADAEADLSTTKKNAVAGNSGAATSASTFSAAAAIAAAAVLLA